MTYDDNNIFARILRGEIPGDYLYEDEHAVAFHDIEPAAPVHVLIIPKGRYRSFDDFVSKAGHREVASYFASVQKVAQTLGVVENGYRLITNHGADASQTVAHFHVHLLAGKKLGGLLPNDKTFR